MINLDLSVAYDILITEVSILLNNSFPSSFAFNKSLNENTNPIV